MKSFVLLSLVLLSTPSFAGRAKYIALGGGYDPHSSAVVLEMNIQLFDWVSRNSGVSSGDLVELFGGGNNTDIYDVAELAHHLSDSDMVFANFFRAKTGNDCNLRHNRLSSLAGESSRSNLFEELDALKNSTTKKARFYYTGHGSPGREDDEDPDSKDDYSKNVMDLFDGEKVSVQEFTKALDELPPSLPIQVVMVQCYSGGFAQMVFEGGEANGKLSAANRCGFFSQRKDAVASGCTPDLNIREEYSPYFYAAINGENEMGNKVFADYNHDGRVTSDEAHAYVIIEENSIDVPVKTSDQYLRFQNYKESKGWGKIKWSQFMKKMNPVEIATANGLAAKLGLNPTPETPYSAIDQATDKAEKELEALQKDSSHVSAIEGKLKSKIQSDLQKFFPIFKTQYGAQYGSCMMPTAELFQKAKQALITHPNLEQWVNAKKIADQKEEESYRQKKLYRKWVRLNYLLYSKLLENHFYKKASAEARAKYEQLKACESESFF